MSEQTPEQRDPYEKTPDMPSFRLRISDEQVIELHHNNTGIFLHTNQSMGDHVFVAMADKEQGTAGLFIWRQQVGDETFMQILQGLAGIEMEAQMEQFMTEPDQERFKARFGFHPDVNIDTHEIPPTLTAEMGRWAVTLATMPDEDIQAEFELPQPRRRFPDRWV